VPHAFARGDSPQGPGLLSIGRYDSTLIQLAPGTRAPAGARVVSRRLGVWQLSTPAAKRALPRLLAAGAVRAVEPDQPIRPLRAAEADPLAGSEWWRAAVGADRAAPPGPGKPITVIDSGLDVTHPEFAGRPNTQLLTPQNLQDPTGGESHGTAVSSVAAAPENAQGVVGVYPQAVLREADARTLTLAHVLAALDAAVNAGPSVINMSFGIDDSSALLRSMVLVAFARGSVLVAAAGNERAAGTGATAPANLPHVLSIAATDRLNGVAEFSTASVSVDLAAPGVDIPVAVPGGYTTESGTSFSAPIVTGATAWVWTARPTLEKTQIFDLMRYSARDIGPRGFDRDTGFGLLDIPRALTQAPPPVDPQEPNDDIAVVKARGLFRSAAPGITRPGKGSASFRARVDSTEDPEDVYRVYVAAGRTVRISVAPDTDADVDLWKTSATTVGLRGAARTRNLLATSRKRGKTIEKVSVRNRTRRGFYAYLDVYVPSGGPLDSEYRVTASTARR